MREILFRGKQLDNGDWVEGYYTELPCGSLGATIFSNDDELICEDTKSYIIKVFTKQHTNYSNSNPLQVIECEKYEVIPETIVDFTGLCDKHGNKIFEGDILETAGPDGADYQDVVHFGHFNDDDNHGNEYIGFYVKSGNYTTSLLEMPLGKHNYCYVIGNIYDNPELLEDIK